MLHRPWWSCRSNDKPMSFAAAFWDFHLRYVDAMHSCGMQPWGGYHVEANIHEPIPERAP